MNKKARMIIPLLLAHTLSVNGAVVDIEQSAERYSDALLGTIAAPSHEGIDIQTESVTVENNAVAAQTAANQTLITNNQIRASTQDQLLTAFTSAVTDIGFTYSDTLATISAQTDRISTLDDGSSSGSITDPSAGCAWSTSSGTKTTSTSLPTSYAAVCSVYIENSTIRTRGTSKNQDEKYSTYTHTCKC